MTIKIHVHPEKNEREFSESFFGPIYFQINDVYFPEAFWGDFVVVVLRWWVRELGTYDGKLGKLLFMDGPFRIEFEPSQKNVQLSLIENDRVVGKTELELEELTRALVAAVEDTLQFYAEVTRPDLEELRDSWKSFRT